MGKPMDLKEYLIQIAPDFTIFDLLEDYVYDNNIKSNSNSKNQLIKDIFEYGTYKNLNNVSITSNLYRGMIKLMNYQGDVENIINQDMDPNNYFYIENGDYIIFIFWSIDKFKINLTHSGKDNEVAPITWLGVGF